MPRNRAICIGDRARAGVGESYDTFASVQDRMSRWTNAYLEKFIVTAKSDLWRRAAVHLLSIRQGTTAQLAALNTRRSRLKRSKRKT